MTRRCTHRHTTLGPDHSYTGSVAVHPYTTENQVAHGNTTYDQTCRDCGACRAVNANAGQTEVGPWSGGRTQTDEDRYYAGLR